MRTINILDCTLREAPIKDLVLGANYIQKFIKGLENSRIDIIECGFLKDIGARDDNTIFLNPTEIEPFLTNKKPTSQYVALVNYGRYDLKNLTPNNGKSVDGIRICFKKHERNDVFNYAKQIKEKGYDVYIQNVDILSYSDLEILEVIENVNRLKPAGYSIVDTFGSMYAEDLRHIYEIVNKNLDKNIKLGFHAHNNLMLAVANTQFFISLAASGREIIVDGSVLGCGRGAGNSNTELLAEFINKKFNGMYNLDELLDIIDTLMPKFHKNCNWGYSIPYFLAGVHNAHVFNVNHLLKRHNIKSKDLRSIIESLDEVQKKKYDYAVLEKLYVEYFNKVVDDKNSFEKLKKISERKKILFIVPGASLNKNKEKIIDFINKQKPFVVAVNNYIPDYPIDAVFYSNTKRYEEYVTTNYSDKKNLILLTSNIKTNEGINEIIFNYLPLIKFGWINIDTAVILAFRLFIQAGKKNYIFAGFDGFNSNSGYYYYNNDLQTSVTKEDFILLTKETKEMLEDISNSCDLDVEFITPSIYSKIFENGKAYV